MASEKDRLEDQKLHLEIAKLKWDASLSGRFTSSALPRITAIVAVGSILLSIYTLRNQISEQRTEAHDKLLQQALSMATETDAKSAASDRKISGIYQLGKFWGKPDSNVDDELIVAASLTALVVAKGQDDGASSVRCAAAAAIGAALAPHAPNDVAQKRIARLLYGNAKDKDHSGSLGLITSQNFILWRKADWHSIAGDSETTTLGCETPLAATRQAIRLGYAYLAQANFTSNDLSYTRLYAADLRGAEFNEYTSLVGANLRCANLLDANVTGDQLMAAADIRLANVGETVTRTWPLDHLIHLSDKDWHKWESGQFKIKALNELINNVSGYPDDFCLRGAQQLDGAKLKP
jgi:hypothetical protein